MFRTGIGRNSQRTWVPEEAAAYLEFLLVLAIFISPDGTLA